MTVPLLKFKDLTVTETDWRGILAIALTVIYAILLALGIHNIEVFAIAIGLIIGWYFGNREKNLYSPYWTPPLKILRKTNKSPIFNRTLQTLRTHLEKAGGYEAFDDLYMGEIAKTAAHLASLERFLKHANRDMNVYYKFAMTRSFLLRQLRGLVEDLAISRSVRLGLGQAEKTDELMARVLEALNDESRSQADSESSQGPS